MLSEERIADIQRRLSQGVCIPDVNELIAEIHRLKAAIQRHRDCIIPHSPSFVEFNNDRELWSAIDEAK